MVTLRTYANSIEAGMAKSWLEEHGIPCRLADEGANALGGAPMAMPIRLLVPEEHLVAARKVLEEKGTELPENFTPPNDPAEAETVPEVNESILAELQRARGRSGWHTFFGILVLILLLYLISELPRRTYNGYREVRNALREGRTRDALELANSLVRQYPGDFYSHEYLGDVFMRLNKFADAEQEYTTALRLAPPESLKEKIEQARLMRASASPSPTPR